MSCVAELMSPVEHTLVSTQPLGDAAILLRDSDAALVVVDPAGHTVGVLSDEDLAATAAEHPRTWAESPCADACSGATEFLRPEQPIEGVLWRYRTEGVRPLAVLNGWKPAGILYPDRVFLWCLEQPHLDVTRLAMATPAIALGQPTDQLRVSTREAWPTQDPSPVASPVEPVDAMPTDRVGMEQQGRPERLHQPWTTFWRQ